MILRLRRALLENGRLSISIIDRTPGLALCCHMSDSLWQHSKSLSAARLHTEAKLRVLGIASHMV